MKWAVVVLIVLGLLAALSAAFLVRALRSEQRAELSGKGVVNAVVATKSLPAMSWLTLQNVTVKKVARKGLAADYFSDPAEVIGKVLAVPVVQDQPLSKRFLIAEGRGAQLAAGLPHGMRAMSVPVSRHSVMGGLLYPGCVVDVIATFRLRGQEDKGQAISTTLLHSVQVLAIQAESIVSENKLEKNPTKSASAATDSSSTLTVTLMVDTRQAEALQLAMDNGKVTIAMRNPLDQRTVDSEAMVLSQGRLAKLGEMMATSVFADTTGSDDMDSNDFNSGDPNRVLERSAVTADQSTERLRRIFGDQFSGRESPQWEITVIRGREVKEEVVELPSAGTSAPEQSK
jgi:pilus assembly protein CpaB